MKVFIDGKAGTTGLRIYERLKARADVDLVLLSEEERRSTAARREAMNASDVVFLCLPDDAAREAVGLLENPRTVLIDASTAHRTANGWAYGFPELDPLVKAAVCRGRRIANPGCHASGFLALVYPLVKAGIAPRDYPFVCHSLTGYTGGGKKMIAAYEDGGRSALLGAPRAYALGQEHKHLAEMQWVASLTRAPAFVPVVSDFDCGMLVTVPVFCDLFSKRVGAADLRAFYAEYYAGSPVIKISDRTEDGYLSAAGCRGKDGMEIFVEGNGERITLAARFDNLGKGASGAAIQNMNLAMGLDETLSLVL